MRRTALHEIWLTYGLFDNGSQADAGCVGFPYAVEDKLRWITE
jgi:hypothetical protein